MWCQKRLLTSFPASLPGHFHALVKAVFGRRERGDGLLKTASMLDDVNLDFGNPAALGTFFRGRGTLTTTRPRFLSL
jgi:hypothetical protein